MNLVPTHELQPNFNIVLLTYYVYMQDEPATYCAWLSVVGSMRPPFPGAQRQNLNIIFYSFPLSNLSYWILKFQGNYLIIWFLVSYFYHCFEPFQRNTPFLILLNFFWTIWQQVADIMPITPKSSVYLLKHGQ